MNPTEQTPLDITDYEPAQPTRVQPARERRKPVRTTFYVHGLHASPGDQFSCIAGLARLCRQAQVRLAADELTLPDFTVSPIQCVA